MGTLCKNWFSGLPGTAVVCWWNDQRHRYPLAAPRNEEEVGAVVNRQLSESSQTAHFLSSSPSVSDSSRHPFTHHNTSFHRILRLLLLHCHPSPFCQSLSPRTSLQPHNTHTSTAPNNPFSYPHSLRPSAHQSSLPRRKN